MLFTALYAGLLIAALLLIFMRLFTGGANGGGRDDKVAWAVFLVILGLLAQVLPTLTK